MDIIKTYYCSNELKYINVNGEPWFRGKDVATILEYVDTVKAIANNVSEDDRNKLEELMGDFKSPIGYRDRMSVYINESGLYCLIFGSKKQEAKMFKKWVCSEILPSIRKYGSYMTKELAIKQWNLYEDNQEEALRQIRNPTGENALHYTVVKHIKTKYPHVIITAGLGENQITHYTRLDSYYKGYEKGQPDLELKCKLENGFTDVAVIELKNPDNSNRLSVEQLNYLKKLEQINVSTLVSNDIEEIVNWLSEHYTKIRKIKNPIYDFSTNENVNYWINKLHSKAKLINECQTRNMDTKELWKKTNKNIASILIAFDKNI